MICEERQVTTRGVVRRGMYIYEQTPYVIAWTFLKQAGADTTHQICSNRERSVPSLKSEISGVGRLFAGFC